MRGRRPEILGKDNEPGELSARSGDFSELTPTCGLCRALRPLSSYNVYVTTRITGLVRSHEAAGASRSPANNPHTRPLCVNGGIGRYFKLPNTKALITLSLTLYNTPCLL